MANLSKYQHSLETCKTNWLLPTSAFRSFDYTRALTFFKSFLIPLSEPLLSLRLYSIYWTTSYNQISFYFNGLGDPFDTSDTIDTLDKLCDAASLSCLCTLSDEDSRSEDIITEPGSPKLPPTPPKTPPPADSSEISSPSKGCDEVD